MRRRVSRRSARPRARTRPTGPRTPWPARPPGPCSAGHRLGHREQRRPLHGPALEQTQQPAAALLVPQRRVAQQPDERRVLGRADRADHAHGLRGRAAPRRRPAPGAGGRPCPRRVPFRYRGPAGGESSADVAGRRRGDAGVPGHLAHRGLGALRQQFGGLAAARGAVQRPDPAVPAPAGLRVRRGAGREGPQRRHGLGADARDAGHGPVRQVRPLGEDALRRGPPVLPGQGEAVRHVGADREKERFLGRAVEQAHLDRGVALRLGGQDAVHAVDDAQGGPLHEDRRKRLVGIRQAGDVLGVFSAQPGGISGDERRDRYGSGFLVEVSRQCRRHEGRVGIPSRHVDVERTGIGHVTDSSPPDLTFLTHRGIGAGAGPAAPCVWLPHRTRIRPSRVSDRVEPETGTGRIMLERRLRNA